MYGSTFHHKPPAAFAWLGLCALLATTSMGRAGDASDWKHGKHSATRLIGGGQVSGQSYRAGVEIKLASGWKTYWRYPGDSGVPPRFDFSGSSNLKHAEILWPAPIRFTDAGGVSIGYKEGVVFPLRITPHDPAQPVSIRLALDYAICEKLCVPAEASLSLDMKRDSGAHDKILAASERLVPRRGSLGETAPLAVRDVHIDRTNPPRVTVTIAAPTGAKADLFAEGPGSDWSLPLPEPVGDQNGPSRQFVFDLNGMPPGTSGKGAMVTLTAVAEGAAVEVTTALD